MQLNEHNLTVCAGASEPERLSSFSRSKVKQQVCSLVQQHVTIAELACACLLIKCVLI